MHHPPILCVWYRSWVNSLNPLYQKAGLRVEPDRTNWGVKGVSCILKAGKECVPPAKVFWDMVLALEKSGYRAGTSLFGVPYDWRLPPTRNKLCADLARILFHVTNTTTHRKAIIAAHSLGNLQLLHCFQSVFGVETLSRVKGLVAIAAPWAGAPQGLRVLFSGAEMVSRLIITDAVTRDFARQMPGAYMLLPDERVWGNHSILQVGGLTHSDSYLPSVSSSFTIRVIVIATRVIVITTRVIVITTRVITTRVIIDPNHPCVTTLAACLSPNAHSDAPPTFFEQLAPDDDPTQPTEYRGRVDEIDSLFGKMEAYRGVSASGMRNAYESALRVVDVWRPPPLPVVCVIGSGKPTHVGFGYCEAWPRNMDEEPCTRKLEDGDATVPTRSAESVCAHWQKAKEIPRTLSLAYMQT